MVLSDKTIKEYLNNGKILIDPIDQSDIQPASVDLHIDKGILIFKNSVLYVLPQHDTRLSNIDLLSDIGIDLHISIKL